jgi:Gram-negative bacterial TonB protein C-terminal
MVVILVCCALMHGRDADESSEHSQFEIARHTFLDVGPPNDFYELFVVRESGTGTSVERITLTPPGDACFQSAKVEVAKGSLAESISSLLGRPGPCAIPEKELSRERKRCKKCLSFSGANLAMSVQCGAQTRIIRSDILDKDMFDAIPNTPRLTSWTMQLLKRLDQAAGPGAMDRPMFSSPHDEQQSEWNPDSDLLQDIGSGKYDELFKGAPDKPSELYRAAQVLPPQPTIRLVSSEPVTPATFLAPGYPPLARAAHIEGEVEFTIEVDPDGNPRDFAVQKGNPLLRPAMEAAVRGWKFPKDAIGQKVHAIVEFAANCPPRKQ